MELQLIKNEDDFKEKLEWVKNYFNEMMLNGIIDPLYEDAFKPIKNTYDIVFNNEILYGKQTGMATTWPLKDCYEKGEEFLNSEVGRLYQEVLYYFAYKYKVPENQLGGYNV
jgi:hypothetical protein